MMYVGIMMCSVLVASLSQVLLKISANKTYASRLREYLNKYVITGYALLFLSTILTMLALRGMPLSWVNVFESSGYFFVFLLSYFILKERASRRKLIGFAVIFAGILVFLS